MTMMQPIPAPARAAPARAAVALAVRRWTPASVATAWICCFLLLVAAAGPILLGPAAIDALTTLFIYIILAVTWNAMAGYGGLVSIGQQAFFGLGAYAVVRVSAEGVGAFPALLLGPVLVALLAVPLSVAMLRLRAGELAIGMWVMAELAHLLVNLDGLVQGETGTSFVALNVFEARWRHAVIYWIALAAAALTLGGLFALLRSRRGAAIQAIRDDEDAAASLGVRVQQTKRLIFVFAAAGTAFAGALWLATSISFQPKTYFGVQWTAYMIFMVLVGGLGTFEGPVIGAIIFFALERWFGASGVWYLVGLGATALLFSLLLPQGLWGALRRGGVHALLPIGYRVVDAATPHEHREG